MPSVRFGNVEKRYALAAWLPQLAAWLPQSAAKQWKPGRVPSVRFGMVEKRYAVAAWLPKRRGGFEAWQGAVRQGARKVPSVKAAGNILAIEQRVQTQCVTLERPRAVHRKVIEK